MVLLDLQEEIQDMEDRLEKHMIHQADHEQALHLMSRRKDYSDPRSRKDKIRDIKDKLDVYGTVLNVLTPIHCFS